MTASQPEPDLDVAVLAQLRELGGVSEPELVEQLLTLFLEDAERRLAALDEALARGERQVLMRAAHTLRSSSCNVGARRFERICNELEEIARDGAAGVAALKVSELERALADVRAAFAEIRRAP